MIGFEGGGQTLESALRDLRIAETPGFLQHCLHVLVEMIRKMPQDVATLMDLAALDLGQWTEDLLDRRGQRFSAVDYEDLGSFLIETPLYEIPKQGSGHLAVLRVAFSKSQNLLLPLVIDA